MQNNTPETFSCGNLNESGNDLLFAENANICFYLIAVFMRKWCQVVQTDRPVFILKIATLGAENAKIRISSGCEEIKFRQNDSISSFFKGKLDNFPEIK